MPLNAASQNTARNAAARTRMEPSGFIGLERNIQRRTPNFEHRTFGVRCWMFDVFVCSWKQDPYFVECAKIRGQFHAGFVVQAIIARTHVENFPDQDASWKNSALAARAHVLARLQVRVLGKKSHFDDLTVQWSRRADYTSVARFVHTRRNAAVRIAQQHNLRTREAG